jgi:hypothetical protein
MGPSTVDVLPVEESLCRTRGSRSGPEKASGQRFPMDYSFDFLNRISRFKGLITR